MAAEMIFAATPPFTLLPIPPFDPDGGGLHPQALFGDEFIFF